MIHVFPDGKDWEVWSDTDEDSERDGRCLATESTRKQAIATAIGELEDDLHELRRLQKEAA